MGSLPDTELFKAAADADIPYKGLKVINGGVGASIVAAIDKGAAAVMVSDPQLTQLVHSGTCRIVWKPDFDYVSLVALADAEHEIFSRLFHLLAERRLCHRPCPIRCASRHLTPGSGHRRQKRRPVDRGCGVTRPLPAKPSRPTEIAHPGRESPGQPSPGAKRVSAAASPGPPPG
ncbi:hypothetical protein ACWGLG_47250 [Streptomyces antimycoticus]